MPRHSHILQHPVPSCDPPDHDDGESRDGHEQNTNQNTNEPSIEIIEWPRHDLQEQVLFERRQRRWQRQRRLSSSCPPKINTNNKPDDLDSDSKGDDHLTPPVSRLLNLFPAATLQPRPSAPQSFLPQVPRSLSSSSLSTMGRFKTFLSRISDGGTTLVRLPQNKNEKSNANDTSIRSRGFATSGRRHGGKDLSAGKDLLPPPPPPQDLQTPDKIFPFREGTLLSARRPQSASRSFLGTDNTPVMPVDFADLRDVHGEAQTMAVDEPRAVASSQSTLVARSHRSGSLLSFDTVETVVKETRPTTYGDSEEQNMLDTAGLAARDSGSWEGGPSWRAVINTSSEGDIESPDPQMLPTSTPSATDGFVIPQESHTEEIVESLPAAKRSLSSAIGDEGPMNVGESWAPSDRESWTSSAPEDSVFLESDVEMKKPPSMLSGDDDLTNLDDPDIHHSGHTSDPSGYAGKPLPYDNPLKRSSMKEDSTSGHRLSANASVLSATNVWLAPNSPVEVDDTGRVSPWRPTSTTPGTYSEAHYSDAVDSFYQEGATDRSSSSKSDTDRLNDQSDSFWMAQQVPCPSSPASSSSRHSLPGLREPTPALDDLTAPLSDIDADPRTESFDAEWTDANVEGSTQSEEPPVKREDLAVANVPEIELPIHTTIPDSKKEQVILDASTSKKDRQSMLLMVKQSVIRKRSHSTIDLSTAARNELGFGTPVDTPGREHSNNPGFSFLSLGRGRSRTTSASTPSLPRSFSPAPSISARSSSKSSNTTKAKQKKKNKWLRWMRKFFSGLDKGGNADSSQIPQIPQGHIIPPPPPPIDTLFARAPTPSHGPATAGSIPYDKFGKKETDVRSIFTRRSNKSFVLAPNAGSSATWMDAPRDIASPPMTTPLTDATEGNSSATEPSTVASSQPMTDSDGTRAQNPEARHSQSNSSHDGDADIPAPADYAEDVVPIAEGRETSSDAPLDDDGADGDVSDSSSASYILPSSVNAIALELPSVPSMSEPLLDLSAPSEFAGHSSDTRDVDPEVKSLEADGMSQYDSAITTTDEPVPTRSWFYRHGSVDLLDHASDTSVYTDVQEVGSRNGEHNYRYSNSAISQSIRRKSSSDGFLPSSGSFASTNSKVAAAPSELPIIPQSTISQQSLDMDAELQEVLSDYSSPSLSRSESAKQAAEMTVDKDDQFGFAKLYHDICVADFDFGELVGKYDASPTSESSRSGSFESSRSAEPEPVLDSVDLWKRNIALALQKTTESRRLLNSRHTTLPLERPIISGPGIDRRPSQHRNAFPTSNKKPRTSSTHRRAPRPSLGGQSMCSIDTHLAEAVRGPGGIREVIRFSNHLAGQDSEVIARAR
ncbi:hypothetical protein DFS34DRAFT_652853 [Phlyctochytrium arcticum]|nr:hypothetical protein DFS34DRAFT_652853 [Phlyctochytrium arcticum]